MKKSVPILCCAFLVICIFSFISFTSGNSEAKNNKALVGSWVEVDGGNDQYNRTHMIQFTDKGTLRCCKNGESIKYGDFSTFLYSYDENSNILTLTKVINGKPTDKTSEHVCYIEGDGMMISYPFSDQIRLFRRA